MAQPSIFIDKVARVQGELSKPGSRKFEQHRRWLTKAAQWPKPASDGDTIESLARGKYGTLQYLKRRRK